MKTSSTFILAIATLVVVGFCYIASAKHEPKSASNSEALLDGPQVGTLAPDFTLPDVNGKPILLLSFLGHDIVLGFFCGCDRCEKAGKEIAKLQRQGKIKHFVAVVSLVPGAGAQF